MPTWPQPGVPAQALRDAIELAEEGWAYADAYFSTKWDARGRLEALRAFLPPVPQQPSIQVTDEMAIQVWRDTHAGRQPYRAEVKTMRDALEAALDPA